MTKLECKAVRRKISKSLCTKYITGMKVGIFIAEGSGFGCCKSNSGLRSIVTFSGLPWYPSISILGCYVSKRHYDIWALCMLKWKHTCTSVFRAFALKKCDLAYVLFVIADFIVCW